MPGRHPIGMTGFELFGNRHAPLDGGPRGDDLRQAPLYKLDTSLSGAVGPAIGDAALAPRRGNRGGDASIDWRAYGLKRGDYIRVGHPRTGETFRVSTDPAKEFSDTTVPLAQADDAMLEAGLTAQALRHAAYEVQEVRIYCDAMQPALGAGFPEHCNLTPGSVSASGFRLKFGDETEESKKRQSLYTDMYKPLTKYLKDLYGDKVRASTTTTSNSNRVSTSSLWW